MRYKSGWNLDVMHVCVLSCFSCFQLFVTLWAVAHQASLSMRFSRQEYWSGLTWPPPGDLPDPEIKPVSSVSPALAGGFFTISTTWEAPRWESIFKNNFYWSIVALKCCVSFYCTAKCIRYTYTFIPSFGGFPSPDEIGFRVWINEGKLTKEVDMEKPVGYQENQGTRES